MYISVEKNTRGGLEIATLALNKLIEHTVLSNAPHSTNNIATIEVNSDLYRENMLYIFIQINLINPKKTLNEVQINKSIETTILKTLNIKPKNIAIAYRK